MTPHRNRPIARRRRRRSRRSDLGALPEWNLDDLYAGMDDPALERDLALAETRVGRLRGALQGQARRSLGAARRRARWPRRCVAFEQLEELLGRIISFAGLLHAGDTSDPARSKFYGDVQEKITAASAHLLFFPLELNRIDDDVLEAAMADPALGHYRPWLEDVRKEKPYQLEDRVELLFHEKSVTGRGAWNRLFDETMAALRFTVDGKELPIEPTLNLLQDRRRGEAQGGGRGARRDVQQEHPPLHPDHQHARQGQGNLRPLARLQGRRRRAPPRQPGRAGGGRMRWSRRCAPPIRACRTATTR